MKRKRRKFTNEDKEERLDLSWNKATKFQKHHEILVFMQTYSVDGNVNMRMV